MKKLRNIATGFKNLATNTEIKGSKERLAICKGCDVSEGTNWCLKKNDGCGCYLPAKTKATDEVCPKGKW